MAQVCRVCSSERREELERAIAEGRAARAIGREFAVSESSIRRHVASGHASPATVALSGPDGELADLLHRLEGLYGRVQRVLRSGEAKGSASVILRATREARGLLELAAKLTGALDERPQVTVNVLGSPEWLALRGEVLGALVRHPAALADVRAALSGPESVAASRGGNYPWVPAERPAFPNPSDGNGAS